MFKKFFYVGFILLMIANPVGIARAEEPVEGLIRNNEILKNRCHEILDHLGKGNDEKLMTDVMQYRFCYPEIEEYTPFSKDLVDEMTRLAYLADTSKDAREAQQNLVDYKRFVKIHMANIDVVKMAYTLSKQNSEFGNPVLLKKVISFLQTAIIPTGRPKALTPESAYHVINYGEEDYILSQIGGRIIHSEVYEVGGGFYNVHDIEDSKTGKVETFYVNITVPIKAINQQKKIFEYLKGTKLMKI